MGIPTITVLVLLMGGVQLAAVGVLGEYIGRIYDEVRPRPLYAIDKAFIVQVRDSHGPGSSGRRCAQFLNKNTQLGPEMSIGNYSGMNEDCFAARGTIGAFCAIGARTAINPFNHPTDWLSIHEFQYHPHAYDRVDEYENLERLTRTPDMFARASMSGQATTSIFCRAQPSATAPSWRRVPSSPRTCRPMRSSAACRR
jgi:hypothetical protein